MRLKQSDNLREHRCQHEQALQTEKKRWNVVTRLKFDLDLLDRHLSQLKLSLVGLSHVSPYPKIARK